MIVKGRPIDKFDKNSVGILEASEKFVERNCLMEAQKPWFFQNLVPLRITNINKEPCFVCKNMVAGTFEPVEIERGGGGWGGAGGGRQLTPFPLVISKIEIFTPT